MLSHRSSSSKFLIARNEFGTKVSIRASRLADGERHGNALKPVAQLRDDYLMKHKECVIFFFNFAEFACLSSLMGRYFG